MGCEPHATLLAALASTLAVAFISTAAAADSSVTGACAATRTVGIGFFIMNPHFLGVSPFAPAYFTNVGIGGSKKSTMDKDSSTWNLTFPCTHTVPPTTAPYH